MDKNKRRISLIVILIILLAAADIYAGAVEFTTNIYINNEKSHFNLKPKIIDGSTIVPLRELMTHLNYKVEYDEVNKKVVAENKTIKINVDIEEKTIKVNDSLDYKDENMRIYDDSVYLSLRPLIESLPASISWIEKENKISIELEKEEAYNIYAKMKNRKTGKKLELDMDYDSIIDVLGNPDRIDCGRLDSKWLIYHYDYRDYNSYIKLKVKDRRLIAMETMGSNWEIADKIGVESSLENSESMVEKYDRNGVSLELEENSGKISFIKIEKNAEEIILDSDLKDIILDPYKENVLESMEKQIVDYLNIYRLKNARKKLCYNEDLSQMAKTHSKDMGDNDYYGYLNSNGETFEKRLTKIARKNNFISGAENIYAGINTPKDVVNIWMNSDIYSEQILEEFDFVGVGVYFKLESRYGLYFTVDFAGVEVTQ